MKSENYSLMNLEKLNIQEEMNYSCDTMRADFGSWLISARLPVSIYIPSDRESGDSSTSGRKRIAR